MGDDDREGGPDDSPAAVVADENLNGHSVNARRIRSTRRRGDTPDLPSVPMRSRTVGRSFTGNDGRIYLPSMFLTLTLPSYGQVRAGVPLDPETYDYRRAALDAVVFPRLVDRFWQNLRRVAGYRVQYFAVVEPQHRLAPHLHAAIRGTIPRQVIKRWWRRPICRCGGRPSTSPSMCSGSRAGTGTTTAIPTPASCSRPGKKPSTRPTPTPRHALRGSVRSTTWPGSSPRPRTRTGPSGI